MAIQSIKSKNWTPIKLIVWGISAFAAIFSFLWFSVHEGYSGERITDEIIRNALGNSPPHRVMLKQRKRLQTILDSFLIGDSTLIQKNVDEIIEDMREVSNTYPPITGKEAEMWKAMSGVMSQSEQAKAEMLKGDYIKAYSHFASITFQCIQCHQSQRSWGVFPEPPPESKDEKNSQTLSEKQ